MSTVPPGTGPLSPDFTGIDPAQMDAFITDLNHARGVISEHTEATRRLLTANGVPATSLDAVGAVGVWIDEQLPDLRRRLGLAQSAAKLPTWSSGAVALLPYREDNVISSNEAQRLGRELAARYSKLNPNAIWDLGLASDYQMVLSALAVHVHDPDFTGAFFAALGTEQAMRLPVIFRETLGQPEDATLGAPRPEDDILRTISQAFGTAVSAGSQVPGVSAIKKALVSPSLSDRDAFGASLLLSAGDFPTEWLAQVAVARGLDKPRTIDAGYLFALGNNPAAARLAMSAITTHATADRPELKSWLKDFSDRTGRSNALAGEADAFGRMLAAMAGAYDESDGKHSEDAAAFAFTIMTTMPHLEIGQATRVHLAEIAGAYATEITEGADLGDIDHLLPSAFSAPQTRIPGLHAKFRLSPQDTYRFIKLFSDSLDDEIPFHGGMNILTNRLIGQGVPDMVKKRDSSRLDETFAALGSVSGLQLAVLEDLGRDKDDEAELSGKVTSWLTGTAMNLIGLLPFIGSIPWTTLSIGEATIDTFKPGGTNESDKIRTTAGLETLGRQHAVAQSLMDAGFKPKVSPTDHQAAHPTDVAIADSDDRLRPFSDILKEGEPGLEALDRWFLENGMGSGENLSLGERSDQLATIFEGRRVRAENRAQKFED